MPELNPRYRAGAEGQPPAEEIDLWLLLEICRRHWLLILVLVVGATAAGAAYVMTRPDTYTAASLVQKLERASPLSTLASQAAGEGLPPDAMASEVELLHSASVLGPVVEGLALNLRLPDHPQLRDELLVGARTDAAVVPRQYLIRADGARMALVDPESGAVVSEAGPGETLTAEGVSIPVVSVPTLTEPVPLSVGAVPDAVDGLRRNLSIAQAENTSLIRIGFTARDPDHAASVVNAVAESYRNRAAAVAREAATRRRVFLAEQMASVADSVQQVQSQLARFQERSRVLDPVTEGESLAQSLRQEELQIRQLRYQQNLLQSLAAGLTEDGSGEGLERIVTLSEEMVPGAEAVYTRLRELQDERQRMTAERYGYREGSSRVAVVDSLIQGARDELRSLAEESLELTGSRLAEAQAEVAQLRSQLGQLPAQTTAMNQLEQNAEAVLSTFDLLSERYYEAQIAEAVVSADVEVVDFATPPVRPDGKRTLFPILLCGMLGLGVGGLGAFTLEGFDRTIRRSGDAEAATGLPILGMVPELEGRMNGKKGGAAPVVVRSGFDGGPAAEAFKSLPAMIRFARSEETQVLAVVSQGPREGKSFTAANLAMAMARSGTKTLLIDCDLHRPKLDRMFELERAPGVAEFLTRQAPYEACLRLVAGYPFSVIPAGGRVPDPAQLLAAPRFRAMIEQARATFDMVILDTPPVLAVSEVLEMVQVVDGVVLVARAEQTNRFALEEAANRLRKVNAPLLGIVLNGVESGAGYGAYGGYYYRYHAYDYAGSE